MSTISAGVTVPTALNLSGDTTGALTFQVSGTVTAATITAAGEVGIGTASTGFNAAGLPLVIGSGSGNTGMTIFSGTAGVGSIHFGDTVTTGADGYRGFLNYNHSTNAMQLGTDATARMTIDSSGNVGINSGVLAVGGSPVSYVKAYLTGTAGSSFAVSYSFYSDLKFPSAATSFASSYQSAASTAAASFTLGSLVHFYAHPAAKGAGSTITNQFGFFAENSLTDATNNFGFYSNIASGTNRWNFYAAGTAQNYFAGNTGVGTTPSTSTRFRVFGIGTSSSNFTIYSQNSASTELFWVRDDGAFSTGVAALSPYNLTTGNAANVYLDAAGVLNRSTSSLRYKTDVADASHGLADVLKLRSVTYKAKNSGDTVFGGLIAEEVHDAGLTEFVAYDKEGRPDALHYGNMVALLVKAVQEQQEQIKALQDKVAALESK